jgi:hypothetical protein
MSTMECGHEIPPDAKFWSNHSSNHHAISVRIRVGLTASGSKSSHFRKVVKGIENRAADVME